MLLRLYGIDPRADVSRPELEPWGYVPPARVSARVLGCVRRRREGLVRSVKCTETLTSLTTHPHAHRTISPTATDLVWETYPECPANNTLVVRDALTAVTNVRACTSRLRCSHFF